MRTIPSSSLDGNGSGHAQQQQQQQHAGHHGVSPGGSSNSNPAHHHYQDLDELSGSAGSGRRGLMKWIGKKGASFRRKGMGAGSDHQPSFGGGADDAFVSPPSLSKRTSGGGGGGNGGGGTGLFKQNPGNNKWYQHLLQDEDSSLKTPPTASVSSSASMSELSSARDSPASTSTQNSAFQPRGSGTHSSMIDLGNHTDLRARNRRNNNSNDHFQRGTDPTPVALPKYRNLLTSPYENNNRIMSVLQKSSTTSGKAALKTGPRRPIEFTATEEVVRAAQPEQERGGATSELSATTTTTEGYE